MEELKWPKITKDTPIEEAKRIHQQIWNYAIEHEKKPNTSYMADCVACEYDNLYEKGCLSCPILWPDAYCHLGGLYTQWRHAIGKEKAELACQIRDLPWKFENNH